MLKYEKMSLFDAPPGSILMHGCNAQGVWGRGIAAEFKKRFPKSYFQYTDLCNLYKRNQPGYGAVGMTLVLEKEHGYNVACVVTSFDYGDIDPERQILLQTVMALEDFCLTWEVETGGTAIYCNKFNSGLFAVPWEKTEYILNYFAEKYDLDITVCESP